MYAWVLIVMINTGYNSATSLTIQNITSYEECVRISKQIENNYGDKKQGVFSYNPLCVEVKVK